jgi:histidine ammonia-lyase
MQQDLNNKEVRFTIDFFEKVLFKGKLLNFDNEAIEKLTECYIFLQDFSKGKLIYGINTGFGPMAQYRIEQKDRIDLQYNLIRSHCGGAGQHIPPLYVKAGMICRLTSILQAKSGIHPECALLLKDMINNDIIPVIFEHGGVGASGDLVQLAHLALAMIGEGQVYYKGKITDTAKAFDDCNLKPITIRIREGLSLINGTSIMTGISIVNLIRAKNLFDWSLFAGSMINELVDSFDDSFSEELNNSKKHLGQIKVAEAMRKILAGSKMIKQRKLALYNRNVTEKILAEKVQEYYSLRCMPQIYGPIYDTIANAIKIVSNEINSANDNPVVDVETKNVYHGGNFHGDYMSLEMDKLKIVITKLTMTNERQLNFLLNPKLNEKFAPFVNLGTPGLNLGMQGVQFTATSTTAECQTLSFPNYIHSIPNNNDNQDIVSMGTNSALITKKVIDNAYQVLAIYYMALIQAVDNIKAKDKMAPATKDVYIQLRNLVPAFSKDTPKYKEIENINNYLLNNKPSILFEWE